MEKFYPKILYIVGDGRSGTTLLGKVLNEFDGFFFGGEIHFLLSLYLRDESTCGCGTSLDTCPFWTAVVETWTANLKADDTYTDNNAAQILALQKNLLRWPNLLKLLANSRDNNQHNTALTTYTAAMQHLYNAVAQVSGARVIVDSSKQPGDAALKSFLPHSDLYYVHLVRDPRGVVWSRQKRRQRMLDRNAHPKPGIAQFHTPYAVYNTVSWMRKNIAAELLLHRLAPQRSLRVAYEDFAAKPCETIAKVAELVGEPLLNSPFIDDNALAFGENHIARGNRNRLSTGQTQILPDMEWIRQLPDLDRRLVAGLAFPLLQRYRYRRMPS